MNDRTKDWKQALQKWLQQNAKVMPDDLRQLREAFVQRFPLETINKLTLDEYAVGKGKPDSFCYWLEFKTKELGSIKGGSAAKFGVWWSKDENRWRWNSIYHSAEDALARITGGLVALTQAVREGQMNALDKIGAEQLGPYRYSLRGKPLSLYFPDQFLPISHPGHLKHFLAQFGAKPQGSLLALNRQLLMVLQSLPEFAGFDTRQMMIFLYMCLPPSGIETSAPPLAKEAVAAVTPSANRTKVFISYCHKDAPSLERLQVHLTPYDQGKLVDIWDDTKIKPGAKWRDEIAKAIEAAKVAVLLISADYLASRFIAEDELPPLLAAAEQEGTTIFPVILSPCAFEYTKLAQFQAVNSPSMPISKMSKHQREALWEQVARLITNASST
jgi:TIR domain